MAADNRPNVDENVYTKKVKEINFHKYGVHIFHTNNEKNNSLYKKYKELALEEEKGYLW